MQASPHAITTPPNIDFKLETFALELVYIQRWLRETFDRNRDKNARALDEDLTRTLKSYRALKRNYYKNKNNGNGRLAITRRPPNGMANGAQAA